MTDEVTEFFNALPRPPKKVKEAPEKKPKTTKGQRDTRDQLMAVLEFFENPALTFSPTGPIYIGIDCGKSGAIGLFYPQAPGITTAVDIPTMIMGRTGKTKKRIVKGKEVGGNPRTKTSFDEGMIWRYVQVWKDWVHRLMICIEEGSPRPEDRGTTGFAVGYGYGMWPLFLRSHGFSVETVLPAVWKGRMGLSGKDKEWSRLMAQRLWPQAPLWRKCDDGRAEALLLAEYSRRQRLRVEGE